MVSLELTKSFMFAMICLVVMLSIIISILPSAIVVMANDTTHSFTYGQNKIKSINQLKNVINQNTGEIVDTKYIIKANKDRMKAKQSSITSSLASLLMAVTRLAKDNINDTVNITAKISNQINTNNETQLLEGIDTINLVIGAEISKAIKTISDTNNDTQQLTLTIDTAIRCDNTSSPRIVECEDTTLIHR